MLDLNNNRIIIYTEGLMEAKELKNKIEGVKLLGLNIKSIAIKFNLLDIEEIKEGNKKALELYNNSNNELKIIDVKNKKVKFENGISLTLEKQNINYIKIEY